MKARALLSLSLSALLLLGSVVRAQEPGADPVGKPLSNADAGTRRDAVKRLADVGTMADLALLTKALRDDDADVRDRAEQAMWKIFARSGDKDVDRLYQTGVEQMEAGDVQQSISTFSRIIERKPDFAEGWNKRATLYFVAGDLRKSLADCDEVLKRNPYHFGALAGYAQIYVRLEYYDRALDYARRALEINPNMEGVKRIIVLIERLIEQRRKNST